MGDVVTNSVQSGDIRALQGTPLLLIAVDGVDPLFGIPLDELPPGNRQWVDGIVGFLSSEAAGHLQELQGEFDLVWCAGWEEKCCEYLPAALGAHSSIPSLPFDAAPRAGVSGGHPRRFPGGA